MTDSGYRTLLWGPANFAGRPSRRLTVEVLGVLAVSLVTGSGVIGELFGHPLPGTVAGIVVSLAAAAYLYFTNAGRVFVVGAVIVGAVLSWMVPRSTATAVLAARGESRTVVVTDVREHPYKGRDYSKNSCTVELLDGTPVETEAWRQCALSTRPGDTFAMVFDLDGVIAPTERRVPDSVFSGTWRTARLAVLLLGVCLVGVVRSQP
ncbi:hypothetical protein [Streptomyces sp. NPDC002851]